MSNEDFDFNQLREEAHVERQMVWHYNAVPKPGRGLFLFRPPQLAASRFVASCSAMASASSSVSRITQRNLQP